MIVQVRDRAGNVIARQQAATYDVALELATRWVVLMCEDAKDPLEPDGPFLPAASVQVLPDPEPPPRSWDGTPNPVSSLSTDEAAGFGLGGGPTHRPLTPHS